jgi:response regulator RpfG family c-di-GMP phosphodiesterase
MSAAVDDGPVLIVDDDPDVREMLHEIFRASGYHCELATNGREALDLFGVVHPPLTVTDVRMPVMDGLEFLKQARSVDSDAVVLVLTGVGDVRTAVESLTNGAYDFILKPVKPGDLIDAAQRALDHRRERISRREQHELLERRVAEATSELQATLRRLEDTYRTTLEALGSAIDTRDVGTHGHSRRVRGYSLVIARAHGVPDSELRDIEHGVLLHDIGKIGIPDAILLKPGPLTPSEWKVMRRHPEIGRRLVEKIPFLRGAVPIVYHHHERWDGTGYPLGLSGEAIPLGARIFAVADALDAMTFDRPYSRAVTFETARDEIQRCASTHFDPGVVATFLGIPLDVFAAIRQTSTEFAASPDAAEAAVLSIPGLARALSAAARSAEAGESGKPARRSDRSAAWPRPLPGDLQT